MKNEETTQEAYNRGRIAGAKEAYTMFLKEIWDAKKKFPTSNSFDVVVDLRDIEKSLLYLEPQSKP